MEIRDRYSRGSSRSRGSSSASEVDPREKIKDFCRKIVAFMCTQVGMGFLVVGYTLVGAASFMYIEKDADNPKLDEIVKVRSVYAEKLYDVAIFCNTFDKKNFTDEADIVLKTYQDTVVKILRHGYEDREMVEVWTFPAALMFSLGIITMIGFGNLVPKTQYGKLATIVYALVGIPLYVLYFLNVGDALAGGFRWMYRRLYECTTVIDEEEGEFKKRIIVPSTACLWVIVAYILTGAIMFFTWERWDFLDSIYFCVTSLCKLGMGDFVPGANYNSEAKGNQTKLMISYVYIFFGLALVAMCYNLMREEIREKVKEIREDFGQCLEDTKMRLLVCCHRDRAVEETY